MYFLVIDAATTDQHPDHAKVGEGVISCWIEHEEVEKAIARAKAMIAEEHWQIIRTQLVQFVTDEDYEKDEDHRQYYEQALIDKEVLVFNSCPRYPVYYMKFTIKANQDGDGPAEARSWILNECVFDGYDPFELDFWSGDRLARAISLTADAIKERGHAVDEVIDQYPCSRDEASEDCQYYDDAEEDGLCLVFVHDPCDS